MKEHIVYNSKLASDGRAAAKLFGIPYTVLSSWQLEGYIGRSVITPEQWQLLNMIRCHIWENRRAIRAMLANLPKRERRRLVDDCEKTAIERIVYTDFLRFRLTGKGIMNDNRLITFNRYQDYLTWRHPNLYHLLTRGIYDKQIKSAEARIRYCRQRGLLNRLIADLGLSLLTDGTVVNPAIRTNVEATGRYIFYD